MIAAAKKSTRDNTRLWRSARAQSIFCEAPMHDEERHGDGDGSAIQLEREITRGTGEEGWTMIGDETRFILRE